MATIISSNSIDRDRIAALREQKKIAREVEAALEAKKQADIEEKKRVSDHRIATKMARINGTEPPAPLQVEEPVVEPEVVEEPVAETVAEQAPEVETKKPARKTYKKRTKK